MAACSDSKPRAQTTDSGSGSDSASSAALAPGEGAPGAGDPYFPELGNGGYDVTHYDLALQVVPNSNFLAGTAIIDATATQDLSRFDLDLTGLDISGLMVDGETATSTRNGRELQITPSKPIADGDAFKVSVAYAGNPEPRATTAIPIAVGWIATGDATFVINEPEGASTWYPVSDHPSDKATYSFHVNVPDPLVAIANGDATGTTPHDGTTTYDFEAKEPIASYLTQVAVGDFQVSSVAGPNGVTIRNAFATPLAADATADFSRTPEMLQLFNDDFGPYPFDVYGALVVNERTQYALETQTLSLFDASFVDGKVDNDGVVAHELAHQWFGDSVTPALWKDVWLNEGFATYSEWLWSEHLGGPSADAIAHGVHDALAKDAPVLPGDPGADHLFDEQAVYERPAVMLQAVRKTVGDDAFFTILKTYTSRFAGKNARTQDFVDVANEVSKQDLTSLFDAWLYRAPLPDLPS